ncbi:hypothetical protein [uncultured Bacteroides sp.]|uniref:hypothetical protein n=1 Tax=uncultured Bacteroides sp. TaxID=162156 RepID=UPI00261A2E86|nr:hypothetical protein [uncultured Bacteroides sp.]
MKFANKLKSLREANKFTQRQIAFMLGIDVPLLYKEDNAKEVIGMVAEDIIEYGSKTIMKEINNE